ncbi:putative phloem protein [Medicago truncatula]|uniref:Putative phloem protein n=1 Tax=Medicago truncatula TaxID=3880 RepID=A0A396JFL5_MEDTR|nr:putative phloem protein [Medicago truncatula]
MLLNLQFKHTSLVYIGVFLSSLSASVVLSYFIFPLFSSFQLHRKSGQKCYMLAARSLTIECRCVYRVKELIPMDDSRFPEVAKLSLLYSHEIRGTINTLSLSPNTQYAAYLVFKMIHAYGQKNKPVCFNVGVDGDRRSVKSVCLDPDLEHWRKSHYNEEGLQRPTVRSDGWLEIEMGKFFNSSPKDEEVRMSVLQRSGYRIKGDLFIEGIEVSLSKRIKQYS